MPIPSLTKRLASFPQIGSIRKGAPKTPNAPGADLKWFRAEFDEQETIASTVFVQKYGPKPTELNVLLPFNEVDRNFDVWQEAYVAGALIHRCDGENVLYEIDPKTGERIVVNGEPQKKCDGHLKCKPTGRLKVIIPELARLAFLVVHTTSRWDIMNITSNLEGLMLINGGKLAGVPLKLRRRPVEISTPSGEGGKRVRREKWLLTIEADPEWTAPKFAEMKRLATPGTAPVLALTPGITMPTWEEDDDETVEADATEVPEETIPEPMPEPVRTPATAPTGKQATIKTGRWFAEVEKFVVTHPRYLDKQGKPDMPHLLGSVGKIGYKEINSQNLDEIMGLLADREAAPA